jgi:hypothetical protein
MKGFDLAGYLFNMDSIAGVEHSILLGCYATYISRPKKNAWSTAAESTLGDYVTLREDDSVFFFCERHIYGIGKVVKLNNAKSCFLETFPRSTIPEVKPIPESPDNLLPAITSSAKAQYGHIVRDQRWMFAFKPAPRFFRRWIDMDDLLLSDSTAFKSIRVNEGRSFIKMDDNETQALTAALIQRNKDVIDSDKLNDIFDSDWLNVHSVISKKLKTGDYEPKIAELLSRFRNVNGSLRHEMLLEVGLLHQMTIQEPNTCALFGTWDYLAHQVPGSPFKPIKYMDRMDVFGFRMIHGFESIIDTFYVMELKKDKAEQLDILQVMKYVDWVRSEYAAGNYNLVDAYLIANRIPDELFEKLDFVERQFTIGSRPVIMGKWESLHFIEYSVDEHGVILFKKKVPGKISS